MADIGLTHIALPVSSLEASVAFYAQYANMTVVHNRPGVTWVSDRTRHFAIVLMETTGPIHPLLPLAHLGVGVSSRREVDRLCQLALENGCLARQAEQMDAPVGYWALISDPDGHTLEVSYGQDVGEIVDSAR